MAVDAIAEEFVRDRAEMYRLVKAGDYVAAIRLARAILVYLASTPNQQRDGHSQEWRTEMRDAIRELTPLADAQAGIGGIVVNRIEYQRPSLCDR